METPNRFDDVSRRPGSLTRTRAGERGRIFGLRSDAPLLKMFSRKTSSSSRWRKVAALGLPGLLATTTIIATVQAPVATAAPVGQGFVITPSDLAFILKQIKIAEAHVANTTTATGPCGALLGTGPNQVPGPLVSYGLRTVSGVCNNLQAGREKFGAADQPMPRLGATDFRNAENAIFGPPNPSSYQSLSGTVYDSQPRVISNLIVDQTDRNPAAIAVASSPRRSQGAGGVVPCSVDPSPGCVPAGETLSIENITTDVGLSPPYNSLFTVFGQFFDHGLDFTSKTGDAVIIPLKADDPLYNSVPPSRRFMVLDRTANLPGPDGLSGTEDDIKDATNRDSPFVDLSQNYTSHEGHQVFMRQYVIDTNGHPVSTGNLLDAADGGMPTWAVVKSEAAAKLGLQLVDKDVLDIPMVAADPYGKFLPGPARGMPMWVLTDNTLVEGDINAPVPAPANVRRLSTAFLDDISHGANPKGKIADADNVINAGPPPAGQYDDEQLAIHFVAGDGRINENIGLTAIHSVFHAEHDRVAADIKNILTNDGSAKGVAALPEWQITAGANGGGAGGWNGERIFQAARFVTEMEYQHIVFEEFGRKVQPAIQPFSVYHDNIDPAISAEFASAVYRFGHSMLTDIIPRINEDGSHHDISLFDGFLNPAEFSQNGALSPQQSAGSIIMGMSDEVGQELDEFIADTLRNKLVGLPLDLATLNLTRGRDAGLQRLNPFRASIYAQTAESSMQPYTSWIDFGDNLKNPESLVNFVAAYGTHPTLLAETTVVGKRAAAQLIVNPAIDQITLQPVDSFDFLSASGAWAGTATGLDDVDMWIGGLAERTNLFGGLLGSTFNYVFETQMTNLQNGDRFYYLARTPGMNLRAQLEGNSFAEMMMRNTTAKGLKADSFGTADCKFELPTLGFGAGQTVNDDPNTECNENALLARLPVTGGHEIRYRTSNSIDPAGINGQSVFNGGSAVDRVRGGVDNDTFLGNEGNDRLEGNDGADVALGGEGDDIITDIAGDDVPKGGPGNDAIDAGPGLDIVMAGPGRDFTNGGLNDNETFAGDGDDMVIAGAGNDVVFGDSGSDWIQGGDGQDLLCGDSCAPFFDDPNDPGDDILIGQNGEEDYDAEGGDDILVAGPGIERNAGAGGFDWVTFQNDPVAADTDLNLVLGGLGLPVGVLRDRFQEVEALSGWNKNDTLRGDSIVPANVAGAGFTGNDVITQHSLDIISGLSDVLPVGYALPWGAGNIILGGAGGDLLEGRGANDLLDGDKWVHVYLSVRTNPADPASQIGSTELMEKPYLANSTKTLQQAVFAGEVNPSQIVPVREILTSLAGPTNIDVALFSGAKAEYSYTLPANTTTPFAITDNGAPAGAPNRANDGTDTLNNIECLQFSDGRVAVTPANTAACNRGPTGTLVISDTTPTENDNLTVTPTPAIADPDGIVSPITYTWQANISGTTWTPVGTGLAFVPNDPAVGAPLRVVATYTDGLGMNESVTSAATAPVVNVNDPATGAPTMSTNSPQESFVVTAALGNVADEDGLPAPTAISYQWLANGAPIAGATADTFDPVGHVGQAISVQVSFTDLHGTAESRTSVASAPVVAAPTLPGAPTIGTPVSGGVGAITVNWTAGSDGNTPLISYNVQAFDAANQPVGPDQTVAAPATSYTFTGLAAGSYTFKVQAVNVVGIGPWSAASVAVSPQGPPSAPVIGTATGGLLTATATWTAPTNNGGSAVTGYIVRLLDAANAQVGPDRPAAATATSLTANGLAAGTYTFVVLAANVNGNSPASAASNVVTVTAPTAPDAPTVTNAVPGNNTIVVTWSAPASNGGSAITSYTAQALNAANVAVGLPVTIPFPATSATLTGLTSGTPYTVQVLATNAIGSSPYSAAFGPVTTTVAPTAPLAPAIGTATRAAASATITWTAPTSDGGSPITSFQVRVVNATTNAQVGALRPAAATATSLLVTGLTNGTSYAFQVAAVNAIGTSPMSALSSPVTPATVPGAPTILATARGANGLPVTGSVLWIPPASNGGSAITGYVVTAQEVNPANNAPIGAPIVNSVPANTLTFVLTVPNNKLNASYRFSVAAVNSVGTGVASALSNRVQVR